MFVRDGLAKVVQIAPQPYEWYHLESHQASSSASSERTRKTNEKCVTYWRL